MGCREVLPKRTMIRIVVLVVAVVLVARDTTDAVRSRQRLIGVDWKHELPSGWTIRHNVKFSRNWADWNSSSGVTPRALDWPNFFSTMGFQFSGGGAGRGGFAVLDVVVVIAVGAIVTAIAVPQRTSHRLPGPLP